MAKKLFLVALVTGVGVTLWGQPRTIEDFFGGEYVASTIWTQATGFQLAKKDLVLSVEWDNLSGGWSYSLGTKETPFSQGKFQISIENQARSLKDLANPKAPATVHLLRAWDSKGANVAWGRFGCKELDFEEVYSDNQPHSFFRTELDRLNRLRASNFGNRTAIIFLVFYATATDPETRLVFVRRL
jgi:hypothetical protein